MTIDLHEATENFRARRRYLDARERHGTDADVDLARRLVDEERDTLLLAIAETLQRIEAKPTWP